MLAVKNDIAKLVFLDPMWVKVEDLSHKSKFSVT